VWGYGISWPKYSKNNIFSFLFSPLWFPPAQGSHLFPRYFPEKLIHSTILHNLHWLNCGPASFPTLSWFFACPPSCLAAVYSVLTFSVKTYISIYPIMLHPYWIDWIYTKFCQTSSWYWLSFPQYQSSASEPSATVTPNRLFSSVWTFLPIHNFS